MTSIPDEKRRSPRIQPFVAQCHVTAGARRISSYLTDLSHEGARLACEAEPPRPRRMGDGRGPPSAAAGALEPAWAREMGAARGGPEGARVRNHVRGGQ